MTIGNDLIRRADAFEAVCESCELWIMHGLNANTECPYYANECAEIKALKAIPSAEAAQGEWVIRENGNKECSLCGHERQDGWDYFCGYCGARMKGGDCGNERTNSTRGTEGTV